MTKEQLYALEMWVEAIIEDKDRAATGTEALRRIRLKDDVLKVFGLPEVGD